MAAHSSRTSGLIGTLAALLLFAVPPASAQEVPAVGPPAGGEVAPMCSNCGNISITPSPTSVTRAPNTSGHSATFTVSSTFTTPKELFFTCQATGTVTCGTPNQESAVVPASGSITVLITNYSTGAAGASSVRLRGFDDATGTYYTGIQTVTVSAPTYTVAVTPDAQAKTVAAASSGLTETFTVANNGNTAATYALGCSRTGTVSSCSVQAQVTVNPGSSQSVAVTYATGAVGTGTLQLTASYGGASDAGSFNLTTQAYSVSVTPTTGTSAPVPRVTNGTGYTERFVVTNTGSTTRSFTRTCAGVNGITCTQPNPASRTLAPNQADTIDVLYSTGGTPQTGTLTLTAAATTPTTSATGGYLVPINAPTPPDAAIIANTFAPSTHIAEGGPFTYAITVQNLGGLGGTFLASCVPLSAQLPCATPSPASFYLHPGASQTVTVGYTTLGLGTFTQKIRVIPQDYEDNPTLRDSLTTGSITVTGAPIIQHISPSDMTSYGSADTLKAAYSHASGMIAASVKVFIDGRDSTAKVSPVPSDSSYSYRAPLAEGQRRWTTYACAVNGRCDSVSTWVVAAAGVNYALDDSLPGLPGGNGLLLGPLAKPPVSVRGCAVTSGFPEIAVIKPLAHADQSGPAGRIFIAVIDTSTVLRLRTQTLAWLAQSKTCDQLTFLDRSQFNYSLFSAAPPNDPLWNGYPYGDLSAATGRGNPWDEGTEFAQAPVPKWSGLFQRVLSAIAQPRQHPNGGPSALAAPRGYRTRLPDPGPIDTMSLRVELNGTVIVNNSVAQVSGVSLVKRERLTQEVDIQTAISQFHRTNYGGWNEIIVSIADTAGRRTYVRGRFVYAGAAIAGPAQAVTMRPLRKFIKQDQGECAAYGAFQCDGVLLSQTIPGFVTRDRSRDLHLVYRSTSQRARTVLPVEVKVLASQKAPDSIWLMPRVAGITDTARRTRWAGGAGAVSGPGATNLFESRDEVRIAATELAPLGTGTAAIATVTHVARSWYPTSLVPQGWREDTVSQPVVQTYLSDLASSRVGAGWQIAELQRLIRTDGTGAGLRWQGDTAAVLLQGDGSWSVFRKPGASWVAPPGETARLVTLSVADAQATHVLYLDNGSSIGFQSDGWQRWTRDLVGNQTTYNYNSGKLESIEDPSQKAWILTYHISGSWNGLVREFRIRRSSNPTDTVTVATLQYVNASSPRLRFVRIWRSATASDSTTYGYRSIPSLAIVDTVFDPRHTVTNPVFTRFTWDTTLWSPEGMVQPLGLTSAIRFPVRRAAPRRGYGRQMTGNALERMPMATQWLGTATRPSSVPHDFSVDAFGAPTYVRVIGSDPAAYGAAGDDTRHIERDTASGHVLRIVRNRYVPNAADSVIYDYDPLWRVTRLRRNTHEWPVAARTQDSIAFTYDTVSLGSGRWCSRLRTSADAMGSITNVTYGSTGVGRCLVTQVVGAAADPTTFTYGTLTPGDKAGVRPATITDPNGQKDSSTFNASNWNTASRIRVADAAITRTYYDTLGRADSVVDPMGAVSIILKDRSGRPVRQYRGKAGAQAPTIRTTYDAAGQVTQTEVYGSTPSDLLEPLANPIQVTRNFLDALGRLDSTWSPGGGTSNRPEAADGFQARKQAWQGRNGLGLPTWEYPGNGAFIRRVYDGRGAVKWQENSHAAPGFSANGEQFADDSTVAFVQQFPAPVGKVFSSGQRHHFSYDAKGQLIKTISVEPFLIRGPDSAYSMIERTYSRTGAVIRERHDMWRQAQWMSAVRRFEYNRRGQRIRATDSLFVPTLPDSEKVAVTEYVYVTATGRLDSIKATVGGRTWAQVKFLYDLGGREVERRVRVDGGPAEMVSKTVYDGAGRVDSLRTTVEDTVRYAMGAVIYRPDDMLTNFVSLEPGLTNGAHSYSYSPDGLNRLTASSEGFVGRAYQYDVLGNRTQETSMQGAGESSCLGTRKMRYGPGTGAVGSRDNRIHVRSAVLGSEPACRSSRYFSDRAGNRIGAADTASTAYWALQSFTTYTAPGQLYFAMSPTATAGAYSYVWTWYDALGRRATSQIAARTVAGQGAPNDGGLALHPDSSTGPRTFYIYDGDDVAIEVEYNDAVGWKVARRPLSVGLDRVVAGRYLISPSVKSVVLVSDRTGAPLTAYDKNGDVVAGTWVNRDGFGQILGTSAGAGPSTSGTGFAGAGAPVAGGGFTYMRNRWYDPVTGRFLTQDPIGLAGGVNLYEYAGSNPVSFDDPFGLECPVRGTCTQADVPQAGLAALKTRAGRFFGSEAVSGLAMSLGVVMMASMDDGKATPEEVRGLRNSVTAATTRYQRPTGATTAAQRASVQGQPCVKCGSTSEKMVAGHKKALVVEHYETGTIDQGRMRSLDAVQPECPLCSAREGGHMSHFSRQAAKALGLE